MDDRMVWTSLNTGRSSWSLRRCLSCVSWWGCYAGEVKSVSLHAARGSRRMRTCRRACLCVSGVEFDDRVGPLGQCVGGSVMFAANRGANISTIASAAASAGGTSLAIRMVTGLGWVGLGVSVGLLLYDLYYSSAELAAVKAAATVPAHHVVPGVTLPANAQVIMPCAAPFPCGGYDAILNIPGTAPPGTSGCVTPVPVMPAGWWVWGSNPQGDGGCMIGHLTGQANAPVTVPATTGTPTEVAAVLQNLPASDPLSIESNTVPAGVGVASTPADQVVSQPVPASQVTTQVVPASQVGPTDVVVNQNAHGPSGTRAHADEHANLDDHEYHHDDDDHEPEWIDDDDQHHHGNGGGAGQCVQYRQS